MSISRPSGGCEQAKAISRASFSPSKMRGMGGVARCLRFNTASIAEREASRLASFSKLSASDQAVLARFGAAPFSPVGVAPSAPLAPAQSSNCSDVGTSAYDFGAAAAARLLGKAAPLPSGLGEIALAPPEPEPDLRLDRTAMAKGAAEAARLLGKSVA
jgi:hypothetical protein